MEMLDGNPMLGPRSPGLSIILISPHNNVEYGIGGMRTDIGICKRSLCAVRTWLLSTSWKFVEPGRSLETEIRVAVSRFRG
jgi:hypothetical protein